MSDIREKIKKQFISNTLQEYYVQKQLQFSDEILAAIVFDSFISESLQLSLLNELSKETVNTELQKEIAQVQNAFSGRLKMFREPTQNCIYILEYYDTSVSEYVENGVFRNEKDAENVGKSLKAKFRITKHHVIQSINEAKKIEEKEAVVRSDLSGITCSADGEILVCWSNELVDKESDQVSILNKFFGIPHPFRNGMYIKDKHNNTTGVVSCTKDDAEMESYFTRMREFSDFSNERIGYTWLDENGREWLDSAPVYEVEQINVDDIPPLQQKKYRELVLKLKKPSK